MINPFSFVMGLVSNMFSKPTAAGPAPTSITLNQAQIQALIQAAEVFGPALAGVTPQQMIVANTLLTAFGFGGLLPAIPAAPPPKA